MSRKRKSKIEYRYYEMPLGSPVLALMGEDWIRNYGDGGAIDYLHFHNHMEIGICHWGKGVLCLEEKELPYEGGMFSLIPRNFPHTTTAEGLSLSYWEYLFIDVDSFLEAAYRENPLMAERLVRRINRKAHFSYTKDHPEIMALIKQIMEIMKSKKEFYLEEVKGVLLSLLIEIARWNKSEEEGKSVQDGGSTIVSVALEYISNHYDSTLKIEELAEMCHISETHFRRIFKECMNMTPLEYINWVRIKNACDELKRTNDSAGSIAVKTGFSSLSTFNRNFRRIMGISPQQWRKNPEHYERKLLKYDIKKHEGW
ncbi:MAG: helix-turn-helix transcriptional regulator [Clostridiales bacterium]|nr:helix-turn-helix transcriptional regulator [Clostridiales bacterium]